MAFLRARTFFACLPLRSGIWILGLVGLIVAGFGAAGSAILLMLLKDHPVTLIPKIGLFVLIGSMGLFGLISLFGILVGFLKTHGVAFIYSKIALVNMAVSIPALGYLLFATLKPISGADVSACLNGDTQQNDTIFQFCQSGISVVKGFSLSLMGAIILVQFYSYIIAASWAEQLYQDSAAYIDRSLDFSDSEKGSVGDFTRGYAVTMPQFQDPTGKMYYR